MKQFVYNTTLLFSLQTVSEALREANIAAYAGKAINF